jgi:hypothetical protein
MWSTNDEDVQPRSSEFDEAVMICTKCCVENSKFNI